MTVSASPQGSPKAEYITLDGNEAAASVAHRVSEVCAIYPITPSSAMGEFADEWSSKGKKNIWGQVPQVTEMQSEAGAIGAVHGVLQGGALATTFTASQGLLLMIPDMYKIAGEQTSFCMHVAARTVATHALSIFGDHSDVMACRATGFAMLSAASVQEAHDFALIAHATTLRARLPFLHFFDGFRTSHEVSKIQPLSDEDLHALITDDLIAGHRARALTPDRPMIRGTAQNPDSYFQAREACSPAYAACAGWVAQVMDEFAARVGRRYRLFDYVGAEDAERVVIVMGSGGETAANTAKYLNARGDKVGVVQVRLYRPFDTAALLQALPKTARKIAVLDRTKEPGAAGEPLYQDVIASLIGAWRDGQIDAMPLVVGGRYGLSSKEFTPGMVAAVFANLALAKPKHGFTVGIVDDVSGTSLDYDADLDIEPKSVHRALFFGLGADGTVGANKNSIKILGEETDNFAQGYFVYDSKKSGAITISHLRYGPEPIEAAWLVRNADFVACHQFQFLEKYEVLESAAHGVTFLLNAPYAPDKVWDALPAELQTAMIAKKARFFAIDAYKVARETGMGNRINTIMQTCWFAISGALPREEAIYQIKKAIEKTYGKRGPQVVAQNNAAVDTTLANLHEIPVPGAVSSSKHMPPVVSSKAPDLVQRVIAQMLANKGDLLPVSAFPVDGTWPTGTAMWEKRNLAQTIPAWDPAVCIQCNKCAMVCPHAAIRIKAYPAEALHDKPATFKDTAYKGKDLGENQRYTVQVAPEDCTGCAVCVAVCPAKDRTNPRHKAIDMVEQAPLVDAERVNFDYFLDLPEVDRTELKVDLKSAQLLQPLFEFSGACSGCGETPYIKLVTQLFGDRALIANATGCSSIYGGNQPTTPYAKNKDGRGPAWANSLFEDNAEFGLGFRLAVNQQAGLAQSLLTRIPQLPGNLVEALLSADQSAEKGIVEQRQRVVALKQALVGIDTPEARLLGPVADYLVKKSVWIFGGDGWAYDIGYGGLDHVMSLGQDVNILVMDTEVYSNTGGQASKATPLGASAKFAVAGKTMGKKDLGLMAMAYGHVYVARIAFGAKDAHTVKVLQEAESYPGPSLIIAYSHCIAHGYDLVHGLEQQKVAVESGYWPLFRFDPRNLLEGKPAMTLDSQPPKGDLGKFMRAETRFRVVEQSNPDRFAETLKQAQADIQARFALYQSLAGAPAKAE